MEVRVRKKNLFLASLLVTLLFLPYGVYLVSKQTPQTVRAQAPYPPSPVIKGVSWDYNNIVRKASGSDNWPLTWANDGYLYTAYGDGWGFDPKVPSKLSLGLARVTGSATGFSGANIRSSTGEQKGDGPSGKKASGMLMVNDTLYMWVRNANNNGEQCQLAWSTDYAKTWTWSNWKFSKLGFCALLNFGKNYSGARDNYVYMYSPNTPSAYNETDEVVLTRVPKDKIKDRNAYQFFRGFDTSGNPGWTSDISQRKAVFRLLGGSNRLDVTYNQPLGRYLMTMRSRAKAGGLNQFSLYDAPEPWGPWTTVFYTTGNKSWGESQHIPSKWIGSSGTTIYLVFSGNDAFSVMRGVLSLASTPTPTPTPGPSNGDANGDGKVNGLDYIIWLNNYNQTAPNGLSDGDFNNSGKVDGLDYIIWLNNYEI